MTVSFTKKINMSKSALLQQDPGSYVLWWKEWKMEVNVTKTKCISFTTKRKTFNFSYVSHNSVAAKVTN